jgi:hypothetical protein
MYFEGTLRASLVSDHCAKELQMQALHLLTDTLITNSYEHIPHDSTYSGTAFKMCRLHWSPNTDKDTWRKHFECLHMRMILIYLSTTLLGKECSTHDCYPHWDITKIARYLFGRYIIYAMAREPAILCKLLTAPSLSLENSHTCSKSTSGFALAHRYRRTTTDYNA